MPSSRAHRLFASIVLGGVAMIGCSSSHEGSGPADGGTDAARDAGVDARTDAGNVDGGIECSCGTCSDPGTPGCDDTGCVPCIF